MPEKHELDPTLLEILRCPVAVHFQDKGNDPGQLRIVKGCWLVCDDSGYCYPIRDGIPDMLPETGEQWKGYSDNDLPVPPPFKNENNAN